MLVIPKSIVIPLELIATNLVIFFLGFLNRFVTRNRITNLINMPYEILLEDSSKEQLDPYTKKLLKPINNKLYKLYLLVFGDDTYPNISGSVTIHKITKDMKFYFDMYGNNKIIGRREVTFPDDETVTVTNVDGTHTGDKLTYLIGYKI